MWTKITILGIFYTKLPMLAYFTLLMAILALAINANPIGKSPRNLMETFLKSENIGKMTICSIFSPKIAYLTHLSLLIVVTSYFGRLGGWVDKHVKNMAFKSILWAPCYHIYAK